MSLSLDSEIIIVYNLDSEEGLLDASAADGAACRLFEFKTNVTK